MRGAFSAKALKSFLVKEGVPVPGGGAQHVCHPQTWQLSIMCFIGRQK
jgi:hypothetical protein